MKRLLFGLCVLSACGGGAGFGGSDMSSTKAGTAALASQANDLGARVRQRHRHAHRATWCRPRSPRPCPAAERRLRSRVVRADADDGRADAGDERPERRARLHRRRHARDLRLPGHVLRQQLDPVPRRQQRAGRRAAGGARVLSHPPHAARLVGSAAARRLRRQRLRTDAAERDADLFLDAGTGLQRGVFRGPSGAIGGEVQLFPQMGPELTVAVGASGSFSLPISVDATYQLVLIPSDTTLAPKLLGPVDGAMFTTSQSFTVGPGEVGDGPRARSVLAQPLAAASIALRADALPSGLGTSIAERRLVHAARTSRHVSSRGRGRGLARCHARATSRSRRAASRSTVDSSSSRGRPVSFTVVHADGTTVVVGAQLSLRSRSLAGAANVTINGDDAAGRRRSLM